MHAGGSAATHKAPGPGTTPKKHPVRGGVKSSEQAAARASKGFWISMVWVLVNGCGTLVRRSGGPCGPGALGFLSASRACWASAVQVPDCPEDGGSGNPGAGSHPLTDGSTHLRPGTAAQGRPERRRASPVPSALRRRGARAQSRRPGIRGPRGRRAQTFMVRQEKSGRSS